MAKYRKRPVVIEAVQWTGDNVEEMKEWMTPARFQASTGKTAKIYVAANDAWLYIEEGEWVIRDALGFYPCKPSIFDETYERVVVRDSEDLA